MRLSMMKRGVGPGQSKENFITFPALVFPAPGSLRSLGWRFQVKFDAEISFGAHSTKVISKMFAGNDIDPPDIGRGSGDYVNGFLIGRKHLPCRHANARRQTAVHRHLVRRAILVAMIVLQ